MPPKKRKAATAATNATASQPAKRVRIGDTSAIDGESQASTPGGRRRSTSNGNPQYNFTRKRGTTKAEDKANNAESRAAQTGEVKRGRGRPRKTITPESEEAAPARRGILKNGRAKASAQTSAAQTPTRPNIKAAGGSTATAAKRRSSLSVQSPSPAAKKVAIPTGKKRGRPPTKRNATNEREATAVKLPKPTTNGADEGVDEDIQYWLMKAEPESRIEKGLDVKFSIDDLASRSEPEGWDGVRNPAARNNMRAMRVNDLAFFYHSNCKVPGVAGVMRIVEEHSVDETAFDPDHPYYDAKSNRDNPKWELVKVEFVKKFNEMVTLKDLRKFASKGGALEHMQMLKQGRLSVSSVQPDEWQFILDLADEPASLGHPEKVDGYEGGTDGETEDQVGNTGGQIDGTGSSFDYGIENVQKEAGTSDVDVTAEANLNGHATDLG